MSRYFKDDNNQWWFRNYLSATKKITGKLGGTGLIKANLYVCLFCGKEFPRIKCHMHNPNKPFCCPSHANKYNKGTLGLVGDKASGWKGGKRKSGRGYISVWDPTHPNANKGGCILEHRLVMEKLIGRPLLQQETVHHKNGIRNDNRPENLELWTTQHGKGQKVIDKIKEAKEILRLYEPNALKNF